MTSSLVYTRIVGCDPDLIEAAARFGMADLHEALGPLRGRAGLMGPGMRAVGSGLKVVGQAVTVDNYPGDNLFLYAALELIKPGQVMVLANGGGVAGAQWGEVATTFAQHVGIAGVVCDAPVRDVDAIRELGFPIWATSISASHPEKRGPGAVNVPVVAAGVRVEPGDVIVADGDGVLVIPPRLLAGAVDGARARGERERVFKERIRNGEHIVDIVGVREVIHGPNVLWRDMLWRDDEKA